MGELDLYKIPEIKRDILTMISEGKKRVSSITLRLSQKKTYSEAVMMAMKEFIRVNEFSKIFEFHATGIWS